MNGITFNKVNFKLGFGLLVVIVMLLSNNVTAQRISIESGLQKDTIIIGDQIELKIEASTSKDSRVIFPEFKDTLKKNIEIVLNFEAQQREDSLHNVYSKRLLITSFDTGNFVVPPVLVGIIKGQDTNFYATEEHSFYVKPYILLDTIPVDTIYSGKTGFVVRGHDGFKKEIENYIPDSLKKNLPADSLEMARQYVKEQLIQIFSSKVTQQTSLYDQDAIMQIAESSEQHMYIVDKGGILEEFIVAGSLDTLFVNEYDNVSVNQPLFTLFRIKDINEDMYNTPYNFAEFWYDLKNFFAKYWWVVLIGIILICALLYFLLFHKKGKKPVIFRVKPKEPAHVIALSKLKKIKNEKIWARGQIKEYHVQLTDVLREYIENRYGIYAKEMTTSEILSSFDSAANLDDVNGKRLEQVLMLADSVKFAKYQPLQNENDLSLNNAFEFVENTKEIVSENTNGHQSEAGIELNNEVESENKEK